MLDRNFLFDLRFLENLHNSYNEHVNSAVAFVSKSIIIVYLLA